MVQFDYEITWPRGKGPSGHTVPIWLEGVGPDDYVLQEVRRTRTFYEHDLLLSLAFRGPRGGIFVDVGANIGNHAIFFGKFLADRLVCVEPAPAMASVLRKNLAANHITPCYLYACGAGRERGQARVLPPEPGANSGMIRLERVESASAQPAETVEVRPLDDILEEVAQTEAGLEVRLVKIDVEGQELEVLEGARRLLHEQRPQLCIELVDDRAQAEARNFLASFGYEAVGRFGYTPTFHFIDPAVHTLRPLPLRVQTSHLVGRVRRRLSRLRTAWGSRPRKA